MSKRTVGWLPPAPKNRSRICGGALELRPGRAGETGGATPVTGCAFQAGAGGVDEGLQVVVEELVDQPARREQPGEIVERNVVAASRR